MNISLSPSSQAGSALIISLIMLLLISLIGVGSMQGTILQERMASNLHDRNIAFQASERALRVGENWLIANTLTALTNDRLDDPSVWNGAGANAVAVNTGDAQLSEDPSYHIGWISTFCPSLEAGAACFDRFSVTSRGQGGTASSVAILQSMFMPQPL
ncbi:PilX N-terminal domain-containing pilus assembly protein [Marinobacter sp. S6332]|uniref:pilus assembly PilX family protein n=1 Tax=Marinobacter sp. S6332 TaxID=2926403 RepID=UPI001FF51A12|nr:PilX N-terminal domain-containing pilus assembly protein [Marinobacter sp. S6332]MCK0165001.1 PilX N-terminal domain-containing pilus assembly protein [Marinobacter sp. S6332]